MPHGLYLPTKQPWGCPSDPFWFHPFITTNPISIICIYYFFNGCTRPKTQCFNFIKDEVWTPFQVCFFSSNCHPNKKIDKYSYSIPWFSTIGIQVFHGLSNSLHGTPACLFLGDMTTSYIRKKVQEDRRRRVCTYPAALWWHINIKYKQQNIYFHLIFLTRQNTRGFDLIKVETWTPKLFCPSIPN